MSVNCVHNRMAMRVLESATLLNLIILSAGAMYRWESTESRSKLFIVSIGITFAQFCVIIVWSLIKPCLGAGNWRCRRNQSYDERIEDPELESLINYTSQPVTVAASAKYTTAATKSTY